MVTFGSSNLVCDPFPDQHSGLCEMDLILCRNVFIYFDREAVAGVVRKFAQTLCEGGYLITGHAETHDLPTEGLKPRNFPGSQAYQRTSDVLGSVRGVPSKPSAPTVASLSNAPEVSPPIATGTDSSAARCLTVEIETPGENAVLPKDGVDIAFASHLETAETHYARGEHREVITNLEPFLQQQSANYQVLYLLAQAYSHQGQPTQAVTMCRRASALDPLAAPPYQLLAALVEDQGDYEEAKRLLKKVIYLSPESAAAYLELGALYARDGEQARARTMRMTALELLRRQPPDHPLEPWGGPTAGEWLRHTEELLAAND
jgi:chemotaxis protein methyltransferase CheR